MDFLPPSKQRRLQIDPRTSYHYEIYKRILQRDIEDFMPKKKAAPIDKRFVEEMERLSKVPHSESIVSHVVGKRPSVIPVLAPAILEKLQETPTKPLHEIRAEVSVDNYIRRRRESITSSDSESNHYKSLSRTASPSASPQNRRAYEQHQHAQPQGEMTVFDYIRQRRESVSSDTQKSPQLAAARKLSTSPPPPTMADKFKIYAPQAEKIRQTATPSPKPQSRASPSPTPKPQSAVKTVPAATKIQESVIQSKLQAKQTKQASEIIANVTKKFEYQIQSHKTAAKGKTPLKALTSVSAGSSARPSSASSVGSSVSGSSSSAAARTRSPVIRPATMQPIIEKPAPLKSVTRTRVVSAAATKAQPVKK